MKYNNKYIGVNHLSIGAKMSGVSSSYAGIFDNEEVLIGSGFDIIPCMIGDISDAYKLLSEKLKVEKPRNIFELSSCVFNTVQGYFGDYSNVDSRMDYYNDLDFISSEEDIGKVSNLKGKNAAMCVERAMLSQNLLKSLGINSIFKQSGIKNSNEEEAHAYNLISYENDYYIFDSTIPTLINGEINPLVGKIPDYVYEKIISPIAEVGFSVEVSHYNPLRDKDVTIIYDAGRKDKYICEEEKREIVK